MKKSLFIIIAICALPFSAKAQFYGGGNLGFDLISTSGVNASTWNVTPEIGYNISDKSAVGLELQFGGTGSMFNFDVIPYYRYSFAHFEKVNFFAEAQLQLGVATLSKVSNFHWGLGIVPGISYSITDSIDLIARLGYLGVTGYGGTAEFRFGLLSTSGVGIAFNL